MESCRQHEPNVNPAVVAPVSPSHIRNVCIIAHVDHGKTTLSDFLISSNGFLNSASAGYARFLDSREDEQQRLITMKSSCITLKYWLPVSAQLFWIHLVDSPGHVDFSSEVAASVRLCDGALLVVDVIEGVCSQTKQVAERAFMERTKLLLVINKMDKLFTELHFSATEIVSHISSLLEKVNAMMHQLLVQESSTAVWTEVTENDGTLEIEEMLRFSPEKGNVLFCSALDGWAFDMSFFATLVAQKCNFPEKTIPKLTSTLWGSYFMHPKTYAIARKPFSSNQPSLAVQVVFEPLWKIYQYASISYDPVALDRIASGLKLRVTSSNDSIGFSLTKQILSQWLPLAENVLKAVVTQLPSPVAAAPDRIGCLLSRPLSSNLATAPDECEPQSSETTEAKLLSSLMSCSTDHDSPTVVYVAKFLRADLDACRLTGDRLSGVERMSDFVGLARIFSGRLKTGQNLFVCGTEFSTRSTTETFLDGVPEEPSTQRQVVVQHLYVLLGADLLRMEEATAGSVIALQLDFVSNNSLKGLVEEEKEEYGNFTLTSASDLSAVDRCVTLSTCSNGPVFRTPYSTTSAALVRVHVEPLDISSFPALLRGLTTLYKADPSVEIDVAEGGQYIMGCCGEVHLEKCVSDLQNIYACVPLKVSPPIVSVRETLYYGQRRVAAAPADLNCSSSNVAVRLPFLPWNVQLKTTESHDTSVPLKALAARKEDSAWVVQGTTADRFLAFFVRCVPLPGQVVTWLELHAAELKNASALSVLSDGSLHTSSRQSAGSVEHSLASLWKNGNGKDLGIFNSASGVLHPPEDTFGFQVTQNDAVMENVSLSPPGILLGVSVAHGSRTLLYWNSSLAHDGSYCAKEDAVPNEIRPYMHSILSGFQLASQAGPLCEEPVVGVAYVICAHFVDSEADATSNLSMRSSSLTLNTAGKEACLVKNEKQGEVLAQPETAVRDHQKTTTAATAGGHAVSPYGPISGQIISCVKDCCRRALLQRGCCRIYEAMLKLDLACGQEVLGRAYGVLSKRRAQIISEDVKEGTQMFLIEAFLPVAEAFGVADDLRSKASGYISLQLQLSHWSMITDDPFPEATLTSEDIEKDGGQAVLASNNYNIPRRMIYVIRRRKGLPVDDKVVSAATKQRTLTRNK